MRVRFEVDAQSLRAALQRRVDALSIDKLEQIVAAGAEVIAAEWRVQESPHNRTGEYQRSIRTQQAGVYDGEKDGEVAVFIGTPDRAARFLEYGTSHQRAQPVMRPAYDISRGIAARTIRVGLKRELIET